MYRPLFTKDECNYTRTRITTWDSDFIDLDFSKVGSDTLVLLIHGLEGSSQSKYMVASTNYLNKRGLDTVCFNLRSCSGEDNLLLKNLPQWQNRRCCICCKLFRRNLHLHNMF
jgi:Predicted hydrolase of the alpha/beta-hydrolase fold